jgi:Tubulin/FtsZ family, GTPase domain
MLVHIGQAGISIGLELWQYIRQIVPQNSCSIGSAWFHDDGYARCIAVDSEPRVLAEFGQKLKCIRSCNLVHGSGRGCANNWAAGFSGALRCPHIIRTLLLHLIC